MMIRKTGIYPVILTSVVCMIGYGAFAASSLRSVGPYNNAGAVPAPVTSAVSTTTRASSMRFVPSVSTTSGGVKTSGPVVKDNGSAAVNTGGNVASNPGGTTSRLSVGKYLNLTPDKISVSGASSAGGNNGTLREEIDRLKTQIDILKDKKQDALIVGDGDYIDISGADNNVISINIDTLKEDLRDVLGTNKDILTEIDENYKLWWCYANAAGTACRGEKQSVVDLGRILEEYDLANGNTSLSQALAGKQGILHDDGNGYISIDQRTGKIGVNFNALKSALGISSIKTSEIRFTPDGKLQWHYLGEDWNTADINGLLQASLNNYVQIAMLDNYVKNSDLLGYQGALVPDSNGYITVSDNVIGVDFQKLKDDLQIPPSQVDVEMEITSAGTLRWRYVNEFLPNGQKKWTNASQNIGDLIDGKLRDYVSSSSLETTLAGYIDNSKLAQQLQDYTTQSYVDENLAKKQVKLTESPGGFISISPLGTGETINIKMDELKSELGINNIKTSELQVSNGMLQWRYADEYEPDGVTKKWTDIYDLTNLLTGYVKSRDFSEVIDGIESGKQIKLTPAQDGYILLDEQTGVIGVDMASLLNTVKEETGVDDLKTAELRVDNGVLQWHYVDEGNVWHTLNLPYATETNLTTNYYDKEDIDELASAIETGINETLQRLALPENGPSDKGLYLLSITDGENGGKVSNWRAVQIVGGDGTLY